VRGGRYRSRIAGRLPASVPVIPGAVAPSFQHEGICPLDINAYQGMRAERELPVVWAVAKGSLKNKAILVPAALLISAVAPWAVIPLLMLGCRLWTPTT